MSDLHLPPAAAAECRPSSDATGPRQLTPAELSVITGGKADDDYYQVHYGPGYSYGAYHYQRHAYIAPGYFGPGKWF